MVALATACRLGCEQAERRAEPVAWQRWRRQLLAQTRDQSIVFAQRWYGILPIAECALLVGASAKTCRQTLGHPKQCWPSTGSQLSIDPFSPSIGTSAEAVINLWSS
jgi:hypothetical protein